MQAAKLNDVKSCKGTAFWMAPEVSFMLILTRSDFNLFLLLWNLVQKSLVTHANWLIFGDQYFQIVEMKLCLGESVFENNNLYLKDLHMKIRSASYSLQNSAHAYNNYVLRKGGMAAQL